MSIDHITASIDPSAIYGGVYDPKFKPYAIYAERLLAKMWQGEVNCGPRFKAREEGQTRNDILAVMESFQCREASFREIATKAPKLHEVTMRRWLDRMAKEGILIKRAIHCDRNRIVTYQMAQK
jgi:hypothetical protein